MNSARQQALSARRMMTSGIDTSSTAADPIQDAVYNRVLMAAMAGRRTMVASDYTGGNGAVIGRRMADYMSSSGGMALTATGYRDATLEDLLSEAASGLGFKRSGDLEELALSLERALDAAGSGLLVIFDAHLLSAPVIGDLFELSGSNTDSGLYMQILLTGGPGLDVQFDKPGLANAARQIAASRWRIENAAPAEEQQAPSPALRPMVAATQREPMPIPQPARPPVKEQSAFTRQRAQRREEDLAREPVIEPPPFRKAPKARAYAIQSGKHLASRQESREPVRSSRRVYWMLVLGILFAFAAGFATNALWPFAPKSASELLKGNGLSALTANLPSTPPRPLPVEPQAQPEPDPAPQSPAPETPAAVAPPPAPVTQPAPHAAPPAAALPPEWNQPVERSRPSSTRSAPAPTPPPPAARPTVAGPTPLTPQSQQDEMPPPLVAQQPAKAAAPVDVCRQGAGVRKPPQDSLSGIAEGFMTDLRNLGRCLNSLAK
jgi:hypothetical protein